MGAKLFGLLDALFKAKHAAAEKADADAPQARAGPPSWNLLVSKRAMHLIPRSRETFRLSVQGEERELSINSMGESCLLPPSPSLPSLALEMRANTHARATAYAGHLLTKSTEELEALKALPGGVRAVLEHTGCAGVEEVTMASAEDPPALAAEAA